MTRARKQPVSVPTGMPYGAGGALAAAQKAVPLPTAPPVPTAPAQGAPAGDPLAALKAMAPQAGLFTTPSNNPTGIATHGLPIGPGAGPEALPDPMALRPPPTDDWMLLPYLRTMEAAANGDGGSSEMRQLVRRTRGGLNPGVSQEALVQQAVGGPYGNH